MSTSNFLFHCFTCSKLLFFQKKIQISMKVQQKREFNDALYKSSAKMACTDKHIRSPLQNLNSSVEKYDTNDDITSSTSNVSSPRRRKVLSGSEWYDAQAYRALNQALGRCIRHANDWGSILLADARFVEQSSRYMCGISRWIRSRVNHHCSWESLECQLQSFVKSHETEEKVERQVEDLDEIFA
ncbi:unnamed protein product [Schistosoma mattheei]|uniref:Uncharacterized protein n=1 Tax=Schistosoma mattheei TaxID=31246 RepID=A0A183PQ37_9TREM|nr:unnamed protein product [Schistosoma mattheei]